MHALADSFTMAKIQPHLHGLTPRAEKIIQNISMVAVAILAVGAAILSFTGLQQIALEAGFSPYLAWIFPVIIDGMVLTGSLGVVSANLVGINTWYPWTLTMMGVTASIWGNVASAPDNITAQLVHAIPPITFALSIEGMLRIYRASAHASAQREAKVFAAEERRIEREARAAERKAKLEIATLKAQPVASVKPLQAKVAILNNGEPTARQRIIDYLKGNPEATGGQVARELQLDASYARKLVKDIRERNQIPSAE